MLLTAGRLVPLARVGVCFATSLALELANHNGNRHGSDGLDSTVIVTAKVPLAAIGTDAFRKLTFTALRHPLALVCSAQPKDMARPGRLSKLLASTGRPDRY